MSDHYQPKPMTEAEYAAWDAAYTAKWGKPEPQPPPAPEPRWVVPVASLCAAGVLCALASVAYWVAQIPHAWAWLAGGAVASVILWVLGVLVYGGVAACRETGVSMTTVVVVLFSALLLFTGNLGAVIGAALLGYPLHRFLNKRPE